MPRRDAYHAEHGAFLGVADFVWCPEGLREADARLLGDVTGRRVLEVGCWIGDVLALAGRAGRPAGRQRPVRRDARGTPGGQRQHRHRRAAGAGRRAAPAISRRRASTWPSPRSARCQFVADSAQVMHEVARVLRPGGRWVFATTHPLRWCFPDDPGPEGLRASMPYWDRTPYVEFAAAASRSTSSTTARWVTGSARSSVPGCGSSTWSSRSGRPATPRAGASGHRCAVRSCPAPRFTFASPKSRSAGSNRWNQHSRFAGSVSGVVPGGADSD